MAQVKTGVLLAAGVLTLLGSGCAYGELKQVLRAQFASELDCPEVSIRRRDTWYAYAESYYKVSGCGHLRTYTCEEGSGIVSYGSPPCKWIDGDIDAPQGAAPQTDPVIEPLPEEPLPSMEEPLSEPSGDTESSAGPEDDGLGGSDLTGETSAEPKKPAKVKASAGIKLGN